MQNLPFHLENADFSAPSATPIRLVILPADEGALISYGTTVPDNGTAGYARGGVFFKVSGTSPGMYENVSTTKGSCTFQAVTSS